MLRHISENYNKNVSSQNPPLVVHHSATGSCLVTDQQAVVFISIVVLPNGDRRLLAATYADWLPVQ
jgi:hypothetical protein